MAYEMYLGNRLMPVTPSGVTMTVRNQNRTLVQINDGEINLLKRPGLTDIQFTLLLPNVPYPFARYQNGFQGAEYFLTYFNQLKEDGKPFRWILTRSMGSGNKVKLFDTNLKVSLEDYRIVEHAKNGFDIEVEIRLKQYRDFSTKTVVVSNELPSAPVTIQEERPITARPTTKTASSGNKTTRTRHGLNAAQVKALQKYFGQKQTGWFDSKLMNACKNKWGKAVGKMTGAKAWSCYQGVLRTNYEKNKVKKSLRKTANTVKKIVASMPAVKKATSIFGALKKAFLKR